MPNIDVTTRSFSNYRDGANLNETILTQDYIRKNGIKLLSIRNMGNQDARGSEGQPLVVTNVTMRDGLVHNLHIQCTMGNYIYCWDDDTGNVLWVQKIGNPIKGTKELDMYLINDNWGILSTPVINVKKHILYCVSMSSPTNSLNDSQLYLHTIRLIDGSMVYAPLNLNNATYTPPGSNVTCKMGSVPRKQRCGLAFFSKNGVDTVVVANGSFNEDADTNQGWVICCDVTANPIISACWTVTVPPNSGGGIWMGGQGCSIDDDGFIYGMTGNGDFDAVNNFGESFYKLEFTSTNTTVSTLKIIDWFTPFTDSGRVGGDPTSATVDDDDNAPGGTSNMDSPGDEDLNSGGPLYLPKTLTGYSKNVIMGAGKDGILYVIDADNMGKSQLADFASDKIAGNYAKLLSPPYGFTYYPAGMNLAPTDLSTLQTTYGGKTHHQHSTPLFYNSPKYGPMLFTQGENGPLRAVQFNKDFTLTYLGCGNEIASANVPPPGGMPGGMLSMSANGNVPNTGVIYSLMPYGNANNSISPGRLVIYSADNIINGVIEKLWDSQDWGNNPGDIHFFTHNKFNLATPANGKIRFCDYSGNVRVYG